MRITGRVLALPFDNIDTDQIIPASHLTGIAPDGLGRYLFDNQPELLRRLHEADDAGAIVAGENFGCGSSREHAAWAIAQRGIRAVIAPSFARIFEENAYNNGVVPITLPQRSVDAAMNARTVGIDVAAETLAFDGGSPVRFTLDPLRKLFLLDGGYLRFLHAKIPAVRRWVACRG